MTGSLIDLLPDAAFSKSDCLPTPVPQGTQFTQYGEAIDFASQQAGFAWNSGGDTVAAPPLYATANSGRTWHLFIPHLVTG